MKKYDNRGAIRDILKIARRLANLTQKQLAAKIGTCQPAIARLENGNDSFTMWYAEKWAEACGFALRFYHVGIENDKGSHSIFTQELCAPYQNRSSKKCLMTPIMISAVTQIAEGKQRKNMRSPLKDAK